jgi:hypothetical protein
LTILNQNASLTTTLLGIQTPGSIVKFSGYVMFESSDFGISSGVYMGGEKIKGFTTCSPGVWCLIEAASVMDNSNLEVIVDFSGIPINQ